MIGGSNLSAALNNEKKGYYSINPYIIGLDRSVIRNSFSYLFWLFYKQLLYFRML